VRQIPTDTIGTRRSATRGPWAAPSSREHLEKAGCAAEAAAADNGFLPGILSDQVRVAHAANKGPFGLQADLSSARANSLAEVMNQVHTLICKTSEEAVGLGPTQGDMGFADEFRTIVTGQGEDPDIVSFRITPSSRQCPDTVVSSYYPELGVLSALDRSHRCLTKSMLLSITQSGSCAKGF
jgi:hypothetical protein